MVRKLIQTIQLGESMEIQGNFAHTVYFWLKSPNNQVDKNIFIKSLTNFINESEFIKTKFIGIPSTTSRGVIENTYTYSLVLSFDNKEKHDRYQSEPNHLKFVADCERLWSKVVVYDSECILE